MNKNNSIVALYRSLTTAEVAIKKLNQSGFDMKKLSVAGRGDYRTAEHKIGYYNVGDRMKAWSEAHVFWTWFWGIVFGSAFFWIPSLRPLMVVGLLFGWIVKTIENALVIDRLNAIGASLHRLGIPKNKVLRYETALKTGKFALMVHGSLDDTTHVEKILNHTKAEALERYQNI